MKSIVAFIRSAMQQVFPSRRWLLCCIYIDLDISYQDVSKNQLYIPQIGSWYCPISQCVPHSTLAVDFFYSSFKFFYSNTINIIYRSILKINTVNQKPSLDINRFPKNVFKAILQPGTILLQKWQQCLVCYSIT